MAVSEHLERVLYDLKQEHLLTLFHPSDYGHLERQLSTIDPLVFQKQQNLLSLTSTPIVSSFSPPKIFSRSGNSHYALYGEELLRQGKVGCIVLAGGQGSRLKYDGPKGMFPISPVKKKTLFQMIAEKVLAASDLSGYSLPIAFMTSPSNNAETVSFFNENDFFGLSASQVTFFTQQAWPILDSSGKLFLESEGRIAFGPNGNGGVAHLMNCSGLWDQWDQEGVEMVSIIPIDNPLALPFDTELFGHHKMCKNDVTIKAVQRQTPLEDMGILVTENSSGKSAIIEYSQISQDERFATLPDGSLKYPLGNIGLYCLSMNFIRDVANAPLPMYKVCKEVQKYEKGRTFREKAWKFEEFIFDIFPYSSISSILVYPRQECFAPLKNLEGNHSPETVRQAIHARERQLYRNATGQDVLPNTVFELEASFYYPSRSKDMDWQNKAFFEQSFIEAS